MVWKLVIIKIAIILLPVVTMAGIDAQEFTLSNGMKVLVVERHEAPVVST
ncbi:MAG: peptidase M16, partial [Candidatus Marinimicrobia bacterium CG_4_10_14_0_2_um_filter_48_9]